MIYVITPETVITSADRLFPGQETFNIKDMLSVFEDVSTNIFNQKIRKTSRIYKKFVRFLFSKNMSNLDTMILLTAMKGGGKSSAAIQLAREWCKIMGIPWDAKKYIAYTNADLVRKIDTLPPWSPLIADESVRFISCLVGETIVTTNKGEFKIKDIVGKKDHKILSFDETKQKYEFQTYGDCIEVKTDDVFEIELDDETKIRATKEHKFLTTNGWKTLEQLKDGDDILGV